MINEIFAKKENALRPFKNTACLLLGTIVLLLAPGSAGWAMEPIRHSNKSNWAPDCQVLVTVAQKFSQPDHAKVVVLVASPEAGVDDVSSFWKNSWFGSAPGAELVHSWPKANHNSVVSTCTAALKAAGYPVSEDSPKSFTSGDKSMDLTGAVAISRPIYNKKMDEALVYVEQYCKGLCGGHEYIFLTKKAGKWIISGERLTLIS